ncbi:MAG: hypothetical protein F2840_03190 [Actinobacteria bacterium]|nr:hypothetical protein [Actinomycetota bacterium]
MGSRPPNGRPPRAPTYPRRAPPPACRGHETKLTTPPRLSAKSRFGGSIQYLARTPEARAGFDGYPERTRKSLLPWHYTGRTEATRRRRCLVIAEATSQGVRPKGF